ncbi:hypothetical protein ACFXPA_14040 [Amycolatopsis sp. NPDC059090]|uniref:hypothetical protein n=1 Tax=unclassified Amycolatopsis TaxID=2618356 RepID=UPI0036724446
MIPYNVLLPDFHKAMIDAEQAHIPTLRSAATMWSEVHAWSQTAAAELRRNAGTVTLAGWQDKAADSFEAKVGRSIADLTTWGDRIGASQVSTHLNALADTLPVTQGLVEGFYAEYAATRMNPLTWELALQAWQSSATVMNELGAQYDGAMLAVCGAAGVTNPADLIPNFNISSADAVKTADAAVNFLTEVQSLAQAAGIGSGSGSSPDLSKLTGSLPGALGGTGHGLSLDPKDWTSGQGLALAGLGPGSLSPGDLGGAIGGIGGMPSPAGSAPVASGLPFGALGAAGAGLGAMPAMRSTAAKRSSVEPEGTATGSARGGAGGMMPPMTPHGMSAGAAGTLRPGSAENTDGHSANGRRRSTANDGVTVALRGRSNGAQDGFVARPNRFGESGSGTVELINTTD